MRALASTVPPLLREPSVNLLLRHSDDAAHEVLELLD